MNRAGPNSVATILRVFVRIVFWVTVVFGSLALLLLLVGLITSLNGGQLDAQFGDAVSGDLSPSMFMASMAGLIVLVPGISYICVQLNRILATLAAGDPFIPENGPRLMRIAATIAIMELARYALILLLFLFANFDKDVESLRFSVSLVRGCPLRPCWYFLKFFAKVAAFAKKKK